MKFKYGQKVRVINGFYEGQEGVVVRYDTAKYNYDMYIDSILDPSSKEYVTCVNEEHLVAL